LQERPAVYAARNVRIAEHGHAIGSQRDHLFHGMGKSLGGLQRQAVDQVHIDAVKAQLPRGLDQIARHFQRLDAMNCRLHLRMEVLDAHAQAIEAQAAQCFQMRQRGDPRIDFDSDLRVGRKSEAFRSVAEELFHLFRGQVRWSAASPVELHDWAVAGNESADVVDFPIECLDVRWRNAVILRDDHIARTEQA
jgi:hypothetical protein